MEIIYPELTKGLEEKKIRLTAVSQLLNISPKSLYNKLRGTTSFTWDEVSLIRNTWFADMSSDKLFALRKRNNLETP